MGKVKQEEFHSLDVIWINVLTIELVRYFAKLTTMDRVSHVEKLLTLFIYLFSKIELLNTPSNFIETNRETNLLISLSL